MIYLEQIHQSTHYIVSKATADTPSPVSPRPKCMSRWQEHQMKTFFLISTIFFTPDTTSNNSTTNESQQLGRENTQKPESKQNTARQINGSEHDEQSQTSRPTTPPFLEFLISIPLRPAHSHHHRLPTLLSGTLRRLLHHNPRHGSSRCRWCCAAGCGDSYSL